MSNETMEIGEITKKCNILLLDIEGTTTSISFVKDKLFPYVEKKVKHFLEMNWEVSHVQDVVDDLRELALEDKAKNVEGVVLIPGEDVDRDVQIEALVANVKWQMSLDRKTEPLKHLQGLIWIVGYDKGDIEGHIYEDVLPAIKLWRSNEGHKVYIYSSASVRAQKLLFGQSCIGSMLDLIDGYFDTKVGNKREPESYTKIVENIGCKAEEVFFLTDVLAEALAARTAGLAVALVARQDSPPSPDPAAAAAAGLLVIDSFARLAPATNKRKPDAQDEAPAPKVAKTEIEVEQNTVVAEKSENADTKTVEPAVEEETPKVAEKMDVEDGVEVATEAKEETPMPLETIKEDITETSEPVDAPEVQAIPTVTATKAGEKTEDIMTEKASENMETENAKAAPEITLGGEKSTVEEEIIKTVIEDVTDKQVPAEIIENIVPIIEEPPVEMEELQNVGEVLEKECDEILSKVQDVTNLDTIPVKLNSIAEETMETENTDSNDIVDKILDTEIEMGLKQSSEDDKKAAEKEITEITEEPASKTNNSSPDEKKELEITHITDDKPTVSEKTNGTVESAPKTEEIETPDKPNIIVEKPADKTDTPQVEKESPKTTPADQKDIPAEEVKESSTSATVVNDAESKEPQVNGKTVNGDAVILNGNGKDVELNDRLTVENGTKVNGSNGDATEKNGAAAEPTDVVEIKTKPIPALEESRAEPIEQVAEA